MPKRRKSSSSDDSSSEYIQLSFFDRLEQDIGLTGDSSQKNSYSYSSEKLEEIKSPVSDSCSISLKTVDAKVKQLNSNSVSSDKPGNTASSSKEGLPLFVPDRFDALERRAKDNPELGLQTIIVAVDDALAHIDDTYSDMIAAGRGAFWVLRGSSGSGKSTFLHTVYLFRHDVETISILYDQPVPQTLTDLRKSNPVIKKLRIIVIEGREALTDFSVDQLEKDLHSINSFIRSSSGERTLIVWPCNADDLQEKLINLAERIGADSLLGVREPIYRFTGPPKEQYIEIADRTIQTLNEGATLVDLGVLENLAKFLIEQADTIGKYLNLLRQELLKNEKNVEKLLAQEKCKMWTVVIAGNDPEQFVAALTRGSYSQADISCLMDSTEANVVEDLKKYSDKLGILATVLDAKIIYLPITTARSIVVNYADDKLRQIMKEANMQLRKDPKVSERIIKSELAQAFKSAPRASGCTSRMPCEGSREAFYKLLGIAQKNDQLLNQAIGNALRSSGLIYSFKIEAELRGKRNLRSDLLCETDLGLVRLELMWIKWTKSPSIANYVLKKLQNYGLAIGLLE